MCGIVKISHNNNIETTFYRSIVVSAFELASYRSYLYMYVYNMHSIMVKIMVKDTELRMAGTVAELKLIYAIIILLLVL